jgi:acyl-CoA-binding protein
MHRLPQGSVGKNRKNKPGYLELLERSPRVALDRLYHVRPA